MIYSEEERKLNKDITIGLIQRELLNLAEYNVHMAKHLDGGRNSMLPYAEWHILVYVLVYIYFLVSERG